ncbi:ketimine reductase mu-crystallin-like [Babylonia areolata]|uniref:ketimine reductase mu-crystallin-like n=1 Tax=Babylonia areolata TaxID=304850 RepID=UPI003FD1B4AC
MVDALRLVSSQTIEEVLNYSDLIPTIENALVKYSNRPESGVIQPVRSVLMVPSAGGMFATMPACSESDEVLSTKLVSFFPHNAPPRPTHHAIVALFNCTTGVPEAILDGDSITAKRTAAVSAIATKHLTADTPKHLAIVGAGVQARSHFHALSHLFCFQKVTIWNHRPAKAQALASELGAHVTAVDDVKEAVRGADVIVTVTNSTTPVLMADWVKPGAHINAVGSCRPDWHELEPQLMQEAAVYVESRESACRESGDIILSGVRQGYIYRYMIYYHTIM